MLQYGIALSGCTNLGLGQQAVIHLKCTVCIRCHLHQLHRQVYPWPRMDLSDSVQWHSCQHSQSVRLTALPARQQPAELQALDAARPTAGPPTPSPRPQTHTNPHSTLTPQTPQRLKLIAANCWHGPAAGRQTWTRRSTSSCLLH